MHTFDLMVKRIQRLHHLIKIKGTGTPAQLAARMEFSERSIYEYMRGMKENGAPIAYDRAAKTYYYKYDVDFLFGFVDPKFVAKQAIQDEQRPNLAANY